MGGGGTGKAEPASRQAPIALSRGKGVKGAPPSPSGKTAQWAQPEDSTPLPALLAGKQMENQSPHRDHFDGWSAGAPFPRRRILKDPSERMGGTRRVINE
jgi:hypothetical protein